MDRQIIYPGAIPLETDLLNTNKYAMIGLAKLAAAMMGSTTYLRGLSCTPSSPASMVVSVAQGEIYSLQSVDNSDYSSIPADTINTILKQGIVMSPTSFTLTAPVTAGQSINYLIQIAYSDTDSGATVLPYYNAANPSVAYSGPNNSGAAQNTVRSGVCTVAIKTGIPATAGTQITPSVDAGYTAAWVITVSQGATTITAANIAVAANAQFLPAAGLVSAIQQSTMTYAADTGAANSYAAQFVPAIPALADGMRFTFKAKIANTGASTLTANGGGTYPIYSHAHQALQGGEIVANGLIEVEWNSNLAAWVMCGNSGGATPVAKATKSSHAPQLGQVLQAANNLSEIATAGSAAQQAAVANLGLSGDIPVGIPLPYFGATPPSGWIKCNGSTFSATAYPKLAMAYPSLVLPDLRGEFIRGWDDGRGADTGRAILSAQGDAMRNFTGTIGIREASSGSTWVSTVPEASGAFSVNPLSSATKYIPVPTTGSNANGADVVTLNPSTVVPTAAENRPRNLAFNYIVRAA